MKTLTIALFIIMLHSVTNAGVWVGITNSSSVDADYIDFWEDEARTKYIAMQSAPLGAYTKMAAYLPERVYVDVIVGGIIQHQTEWSGLSPGYGFEWNNGEFLGTTGAWLVHVGNEQVQPYYWGYVMTGFAFVFASGMMGIGASWVRKILVGGSPE